MECTNSVFSQNIFQAEITCVLPKHRSESFQMLFVIRLPLPTIDYVRLVMSCECNMIYNLGRIVVFISFI